MLVFLSAFAWQLYWSWPMLSLFKHLEGMSDGALSAANMRRFLGLLKAEFKTEKLRLGHLVEGPPGEHPMSNPSERRPGEERFEKLVADWANWWDCSRELAALLDTEGKVELSDLLSKLAQAGLSAYSGARTQYASVRFVRMLVHVSGARFADSPEDWRILRNMTAHVRTAVKHYGLERHADAKAMRDAMQRSVAKVPRGYSFSDLIIYLCLVRDPKEKSY